MSAGPATPLTDAAVEHPNDRAMEMEYVEAHVARKLEADRARLVAALNAALEGYCQGTGMVDAMSKAQDLLRELGEAGQ